MPDSKPQEIQFGKQPPKDADVQFGKQPETHETNTSSAGDTDPTLVGVVPVYAGGDPVPEDDARADDDNADDDDDGGATD